MFHRLIYEVFNCRRIGTDVVNYINSLLVYAKNTFDFYSYNPGDHVRHLMPGVHAYHCIMVGAHPTKTSETIDLNIKNIIVVLEYICAVLCDIETLITKDDVTAVIVGDKDLYRFFRNFLERYDGTS